MLINYEVWWSIKEVQILIHSTQEAFTKKVNWWIRLESRTAILNWNLLFSSLKLHFMFADRCIYLQEHINRVMTMEKKAFKIWMLSPNILDIVYIVFYYYYYYNHSQIFRKRWIHFRCTCNIFDCLYFRRSFILKNLSHFIKGNNLNTIYINVVHIQHYIPIFRFHWPIKVLNTEIRASKKVNCL